jgi:hypothetical protein
VELTFPWLSHEAGPRQACCAPALLSRGHSYEPPGVSYTSELKGPCHPWTAAPTIAHPPARIFEVTHPLPSSASQGGCWTALIPNKGDAKKTLDAWWLNSVGAMDWCSLSCCSRVVAEADWSGSTR